MSATTRIGGFVLALAVLFGAAALAGAKLDPGVDEGPDGHATEMTDTSGHGSASASATPPGLAVAQDGYRLVPQRTRLGHGAAGDYRFRVLDAEGETVRDFEIEHERRMHLIVVRRDFAGFEHLHPRQLADGTWEVEIDLSEGGTYRVFADFATAGRSLTLAADLFVPGGFEPEPLPAPASTDDAGDGYRVRIDSAVPASGEAAPVRFTVTRGGREVDSVEPYLGADGHLVALREHDQAFLHTHPEGEAGGPGPISFLVEYPTPGRYRLFLQFKHHGEVRTAAFTQVVAAAGHAEEEASTVARGGGRVTHREESGDGDR